MGGRLLFLSLGRHDPVARAVDAGMYRVDLHVGNTKVATGSFEIR
jgi:hypothetical protein